MDPEQEYRQRQQVLNSYRAFLSQKLEPELRKAHEERVQVEEKIADYRSLLTQIESLEKTTTPRKRENEEGREEDEDDKKEPTTTTVRIDLGSEILCDLAVDNNNKLFVDIGLGFFCQLSHQEARTLSKKRIEILTDVEREKREKEERIVEHVEIVANGIKSLMASSR
jgi:prefoldin subunit 5